jgi:hypothetical protein
LPDSRHRWLRLLYGSAILEAIRDFIFRPRVSEKFSLTRYATVVHSMWIALSSDRLSTAFQRELSLHHWASADEGDRMRIIGCDLHARQQTLAMLEGKEAREFYSNLDVSLSIGYQAWRSRDFGTSIFKQSMRLNLRP